MRRVIWEENKLGKVKWKVKPNVIELTQIMSRTNEDKTSWDKKRQSFYFVVSDDMEIREEDKKIERLHYRSLHSNLNTVWLFLYLSIYLSFHLWNCSSIYLIMSTCLTDWLFFLLLLRFLYKPLLPSLTRLLPVDSEPTRTIYYRSLLRPTCARQKTISSHKPPGIQKDQIQLRRTSVK